MTRALLALVLLALPSQAWAGPGDLWGPQDEAPLQRYRALCEKGRAVIEGREGGRETSPEALRGAAQLLREATALQPGEAEAWALLGRALLEAGDGEAARPALEAALRRGSGDSRLLLGLGLLKAQRGDLGGALDLYLRLQGRGVTTPLLLRRTGDVQMALGRLGEAAESYRRACEARAAATAERARGCFGLAVALDRDGRLHQSAAAVRRGLQLDPGAATLSATDFVPAADRAYYHGVVGEARHLPPCEHILPLRAYLQQLPSLHSEGAGGAAGAWPGRTYAERAQARLAALDRLGAACKPEYSQRPGTTDEPLGSQRDRDGGVPWQTRTDDAPK